MMKKEDGKQMEKNENGYPRRAPDPIARVGEGSDASEVQLAMVYSPIQGFCELYEPSDALTHGTLFEKLYKPLEKGGRCRYEKN